MANRFAPYKERYLAREPKCIVCKISSANANASTVQTLADRPFNIGIVNVASTSTTGEYKICLGTSSTMRDSYAKFAGMSFCSTDADCDIDEITNSQCNHATDPNISFGLHTPSSGAAVLLTDSAEAWIRLYFLDSAD